jgi:hypothetical protein
MSDGFLSGGAEERGHPHLTFPSPGLPARVRCTRIE